jgi:hypothetical protein
MAARQEWDYPPERKPARRRPVLIDMQRRHTDWASSPLYTKLADLWIRAVWFTFKMVVAAVCGLVIAGSLWMIAQLASQVH